jgi:hypothetical protein
MVQSVGKDSSPPGLRRITNASLRSMSEYPACFTSISKPVTREALLTAIAGVWRYLEHGDLTKLPETRTRSAWPQEELSGCQCYICEAWVLKYDPGL